MPLDSCFPLYLGSTSSSRQALLRSAHIPFTLAPQSADESQCDWNLPLQPLVESIAIYKMDHVLIPPGTGPGQRCYVLTADTLSQDQEGTISGKPVSRSAAVAMLIKARNSTIRTGTAFCLDRKVWRDNAWQKDERRVQFVEAQCRFMVPDSWIEWYLDHSPALQASGAMTIEDIGYLFLHSVQGSYTTITGLPIFEVRLALEQLGFFE